MHCTQAPLTVSQRVRPAKPMQSASAVHLSHEPSPMHLGVVLLRASHCVLLAQASQSPSSVSQIGRMALSVHCDDALQALQAPVPAVQTGVLTLRLSHCALAVQATQSPFRVSQIGRPPLTVHCEDALQTMHAPAMPPAVTQTGVVVFLVSHSMLLPQARHMLVAPQIGDVAPMQPLESAQPTQPVPALHCGSPAMCEQSVLAAHS